ncbi:hypothetical protein CC2G_007730 [Coprinopsis cinerea AmutBmut pab1-1]|nr:hypothetical protein CC2G_007730 [Coprinopsis cinerea AmutBmut pab1-1]
MAAPSSIFHQASQFQVHHSQFNNARTIYNISRNDNEPLPILRLLRHCTIEATHESSTATYAPKCKPGTRLQVIGDIQSTISDVKPLVWVSGPAGGGKTCIQREVARRAQEYGDLAASFFFSTRVPKLDNETSFVATIAYQLTKTLPGYKEVLVQALSDHPGVFEESLDVQLDVLILRPLSQLEIDLRRSPRLITIDGLDECRDAKEQRHLLHVLHTLATNPYYQFRIAVSSRPEYDIRTVFSGELLGPITAVIRLEKYDGSNDIRIYLIDEFARIREEHPCRASIPESWLTEEVLEILVKKASSQFIFASTVVKYIGNPRRNPIKSLKLVLECTKDTGDSHPFADLDTLYRLILHPQSVSVDLLRRLLHFILELSGMQEGALVDGHAPGYPSLIDEFLGLDPGTTELTFCDLHSVISIPISYSGRYISFHHKSMEDFLRSQERAGDLYQPDETTHLDIAERCVHHLQEWYSSLGKGPFRHTVNLSFSARYWATYMMKITNGRPLVGSVPLLHFNPTIPIVVQASFLATPSDRMSRAERLFASFKVLREGIHRTTCKGRHRCIPLCKSLQNVCHRKDRMVCMVSTENFRGIMSDKEAIGLWEELQDECTRHRGWLRRIFLGT